MGSLFASCCASGNNSTDEYTPVDRVNYLNFFSKYCLKRKLRFKIFFNSFQL